MDGFAVIDSNEFPNEKEYGTAGALKMQVPVFDIVHLIYEGNIEAERSVRIAYRICPCCNYHAINNLYRDQTLSGRHLMEVVACSSDYLDPGTQMTGRMLEVKINLESAEAFQSIFKTGVRMYHSDAAV